MDALRKKAAAVRDRVADGREFGLGLRLSNEAAIQLSEPGQLAELKSFLDAQNMYVFTVNGFPYGEFHGTEVKENVYRPDWRLAERRDYTIRLSDLLVQLLPNGLQGSISTVPGSYAAWVETDDDLNAMVDNLVDCVAHLVGLEAKQGKRIHLGLEPEPDCYMERTDQLIDFFESALGGRGADRLAGNLGCSMEEANELIRRHLGICLDTCHLAVQFEDLATSIRSLSDKGILISKVQISSALRVMPGCTELGKLKELASSVYLHQVKGMVGGRRESYRDLPEAEILAGNEPNAEEWRVHLHVPLYYAGDGQLATTSDELSPAVIRAAVDAGTQHFEIETYTFDILPGSMKTQDVVDSITREYEWVLAKLRDVDFGSESCKL